MKNSWKRRVSIIIPIYQTEKYLKHCLESVVHSSVFTDCEVILINDGSTDGSLLIANSYVEQYENISLKSQENSGPGSARNTGVSMAEGDYVFFLDSDDAVLPRYIDTLYSAANQSRADIVLAGFCRWDGKSEIAVLRPILEKQRVMSGIQWLEYRMDCDDWENYVWCALYRRSFLVDNKVLFDDMWLYEDILFSTKALLSAETVISVSEYGYLYRIREGSLVQSGVQKRDIESLFQVLDKMKVMYTESNVEQQHAIGRVLFQVISMALYYIGWMKENGIIQKEEANGYIGKIKKLHLEKVLKKAAVTQKEKMKCMIFRFFMGSYYSLVRKQSVKGTER